MKTKLNLDLAFVHLNGKATAFSNFFRARSAGRARGPVDRMKIGLGTAFLAVLTGCVGYVDGGYRGAVVVPGPPVVEVGFWGGGDRGHDVHAYSSRGFESRREVHGGWH